MILLHPASAHLVATLSAALLTAIWQGAALTLAVALCLRLIPAIRPAARSVIWTAVFLLIAALPLVAALRLARVASPPSPAAVHLDPRWAIALIAAWSSLTLLFAARLLFSAIRLSHIARRSVPIELPAELLPLLAAARSPFRRPVRVCTSSGVDVPSVAGFFRPRILIPPTLLAEISLPDLRQVILHELEHLRRHDDWTNLLQKSAIVLFPLNPVLHWVERRLCLERELACDDGVLRATGGARKSYATCLANLAEHSLVRRGFSLALGAWQRQSELSRRVHRILFEPQLSPTQARIQTGALATVILGAITSTGMVAARAPQLFTFAGEPATLAAASPAPLASGARATLVKAVMPAAAPAHPLLLKTTARRVHIVRAAALRPRTTDISFRPAHSDDQPRIVLISWQSTGAQPGLTERWTLAVSQPAPLQPTVPAAAAPTTSQLTYAAVPTRNGWFFIQL